MIFYEFPHRVKKSLEQFTTVFGNDRPACLARELTKIHETFRRGTLGDLLAYYQGDDPRGEITMASNAPRCIVCSGPAMRASAMLRDDRMGVRLRITLPN